MSEVIEQQEDSPLNQDRVFRFMAYRRVAALVSLLLIVGSVVSLSINGLQFGLDFTGGTQIELGYQQPVELNIVREGLSQSGYDDAVVAYFGSSTDVLIRLQESNDPRLGDKVVQAISSSSDQPVELRRVEYVGPQIGEELRDEGGIGMLVALAVVMIYVAVRFQYKFSLGAVAALIHDVTIVLGFFSVMHIDFDLTVLAAVLAVIGYSLNDTIVVSDRIRENFRKLREEPPADVINYSLTQTLGRTLITSLTTLLVLSALFFFGGELIHGFATALLVGVVVGTYSSVYVSSNILMVLNISKQDLIVEIPDDLPEDEAP